MPANRKNLVLLPAGIITASLVLLIGSKVPLFNGIGFPDEPYRYVKPPSQLYVTPRPPQTAEATDNVETGTNAHELSLISFELGPQVSVFIPAHVLKISSQASQITVTAAPQASDSRKPKFGSGEIAGNFYSLKLTTGVGTATFKSKTGDIGQIQLRLPQGFPVGAVMAYRPSSNFAWQNLKTDKVGADIYEAKLKGTGDYGLVSDQYGQAAAQNNKPKNSSKKTIYLVVGISLITAGVAILIIRLRLKK